MLALFRRRNKRLFKKFPRLIYIIEISPAFSQKLNRVYRKKNKPANVLSFVYDKEYAEIFVAPAVIRREAPKAKKTGESFKNALVTMIIHGMIHCSGLDHERSKKQAHAFKRLEEKILKGMQLVS